MLADGGAAIGDPAVLRDQPGLFGQVASTATAWRVLASVDDTLLGQLKKARAVAREQAWLLRGEPGEVLAGMLRPGKRTPTPPTTTSKSLMRRWRRSPTSIGMVRRS